MAIKKTDAFPKRFLKVADLDGRKVTVTIDRVEMAEVGDDEKEKPVVYFKEQSVKPLVLNVTNWDLIEEILGNGNTDEWSGARIVLHPDKTTFKGDRVQCIRIQAPRTEKGNDLRAAG